MELRDKLVVITGAASGIGRAMAIRFAKENAKTVICADIDEKGADETARQINGTGKKLDVSDPNAIAALIEQTENDIGPIDLFCSNAGILMSGGVEVPDDQWQKIWDVNLMSHVWAARYLVPRMAARGGGYLLNTSSAAGLLNQVGSAPYGVTKHAAVGLAEWIAMSYGDQGIKVSLLCPQAVGTDMIKGFEEHVASIDGVITPEDVAEACVQGIRNEQFLILPHPKVSTYIKNKAENYERWIGGMRKLNRQFGGLD